jgi:hypothetical protein
LKERNLIQIRIKYRRGVGGVQARFFAGHENQTLSCNGVCTFTREEWAVFADLFSSYPGAEVVDLHWALPMPGGTIIVEADE